MRRLHVLMLWLTVPQPAQPLTPPPRPQRFSRPKLAAAEADEAPGTVIGSAALVAGTTVGGGFLGLPAVVKPAQVQVEEVICMYMQNNQSKKKLKMH